MDEKDEERLLPLSKNDFKEIIGRDIEEDKNRNIISLIITGFNNSPETITGQLDLEPTKAQLLGKSYDLHFGNQVITKVATENLWQYEVRYETDEFISDQVEAFISEIVKPRTRQLLEISQKAGISFQIVQYYYTGCNPGYFLSKDVINTLSKIGAEVDIDCYCLSDYED